MIYAGILAGGTGTRMGIGSLPKQFMEIGKKPIIIHTIEKFLVVPEIDKVVVGVHPDWVNYLEDIVDKYIKNTDKLIVTGGGNDRNETIKRVIQKIDEYKKITEDDILITHDGVRPFITLRLIDDNIKKIKDYDAVDTVVEATDTIVESVDGETVQSIPNRKNYYQGQTPQTFRIKDFIELYESLNEDEKNILTDACKIFVIKGKNVALVRGEYSNIKITTVTDLKIAKGMLEE